MIIKEIIFHEMTSYYDRSTQSQKTKGLDPITFDPPVYAAFSVALTFMATVGGEFIKGIGQVPPAPSEINEVAVGVFVTSEHAAEAGPVTSGSSENYGRLKQLQLGLVADTYINAGALLTIYVYDP